MAVLHILGQHKIVPLKLFLIVPDVILPGLILCIAKCIDECNWYCSYTDLVQKLYNLHLMQSTD